MEYESYLAEAGFTVEKYEEGEYGWIYKVTGVIVVDDNLYSKVVPIDNFIKVTMILSGVSMVINCI